MKILVTGANGYLGQGVVKALLDNGHSVVAADFKTTYVDKRAEKIDCDLFSVEDPYTYFGKPDVLLHLAWRDGFVHYSENHIADLPKHYHFLKQMVDAGIAKISVMGTMHEIGFFEGSINENTPCHPMSLYGIGKDALRNCVAMMTNGKHTNWQWLRGYYIVGHSEFGCSIFSKITAAEKEGKTEFPFTMGQNQFDFIDYDDFCAQVAAAVGQDEINGIINICSGKPEKLADRVERFIKENGYGIKLKYGAFPDRPYDSKAVWGDNKKITQIMNEKKYKAFFNSLYTVGIACSDIAAVNMFGKNGAQIIKNGIDTQKFRFNSEYRANARKELHITNDKIVLGHVGGFNEQKNQKFLIDMFKKLYSINSNYILVLVGDGEKRQELMQYSRDIGIKNETVFFLGNRSDVNMLMNAFDCFLLPSIFEGLGIVAIEAQSTGLSCIENKDFSER